MKSIALPPLVLIATSYNDARQWLDAQPRQPESIVVVTPRSPNGARGRIALGILATDTMRVHPAYDDLVARSLPACRWWR